MSKPTQKTEVVDYKYFWTLYNEKGEVLHFYTVTEMKQAVAALQKAIDEAEWK